MPPHPSHYGGGSRGRRPLSTLHYSAAIQYANLARLADELAILKEAGVTEIHCDVMDGDFVPGFGVSPALVAQICAHSELPVHAHFQIKHPERHIAAFAEAGCRTISIHVEGCDHGHRVLAQIRDAGVSPGIALYPATSLTSLEYLLPLVDRVLLLTTEPRCATPVLQKIAFERARILKENLRYKRMNTLVEADGQIGAEDAARLARAGADRVVLDEASVFAPTVGTLPEALARFREEVGKQMHLV